MTEFNDDKPPMLDAKPAPLPVPRSPFFARLMNVIAMPGLVFEEVRASRHSIANWLIPMPLYAVSLALFVTVLFSTQAAQKVFNEFRPAWRKAQADQVAEQVKAKKLTQAQADAVLKAFDEATEPEALRIVMAGAGLGFGMVRIVWWALLIWFLARMALRTRVTFGKALEVAGLSSVVAILGNLAIAALLIDFGNSFGGSGFTLKVHDFAGSNGQTLAAFALNLPNFWLIAVLGSGLARLTGQPWSRGAFLMAAYWIATDLLMMALGVGVAR